MNYITLVGPVVVDLLCILIFLLIFRNLDALIVKQQSALVLSERFLNQRGFRIIELESKYATLSVQMNDALARADRRLQEANEMVVALQAELKRKHRRSRV